MRSHFMSHVLFGISTLVALIATVSVTGDLLSWWPSPLGMPLLVSSVAMSLVLARVAARLRDDTRAAAT